MSMKNFFSSLLGSLVALVIFFGGCLFLGLVFILALAARLPLADAIAVQACDTVRSALGGATEVVVWVVDRAAAVIGRASWPAS